jgi:hypothetical protein
MTILLFNSSHSARYSYYTNRCLQQDMIRQKGLKSSNGNPCTYPTTQSICHFTSKKIHHKAVVVHDAHGNREPYWALVDLSCPRTPKAR